MRIDQRALIDRSGQVLGQVLLSGTLVIAPLHVASPNQASARLLDPSGQIQEVGVKQVVALDPDWDVIVFETDGVPVRRCRFNFQFEPHEGLPVEVPTVMLAPRGSAPGSRLTLVASSVRSVVSVGRYSYATASGAITDARDLTVVFLSRAFPRGASGSPVYLTGGADLVGFVHGNASANSGEAICLVPAGSSAILRTLRCADRRNDELSEFPD